MIAVVGIQKLLQEHTSHLVHRMADREFRCLQVQVSLFFFVVEDMTDQPVDFLARFLKNFLRNFFLRASSSCSSLISGTGLERQISSLISQASSHSFWNRDPSSTCFWA